MQILKSQLQLLDQQLNFNKAKLSFEKAMIKQKITSYTKEPLMWIGLSIAGLLGFKFSKKLPINKFDRIKTKLIYLWPLLKKLYFKFI